jgi:hypothetical protein
MKLAALVSGGLDSSVMLRDLAPRAAVCPVFVRIGLLWESVGIHWLARFPAEAELGGCEPLMIHDLPIAAKPAAPPAAQRD